MFYQQIQGDQGLGKISKFGQSVGGFYGLWLFLVKTRSL